MKPLDLAILRAVQALDGDGYGVTIRDHIKATEGYALPSYAGLYWILEDLEESNYVQSELRSGGPERGGRDKRCYRLTGHGLAALKAMENAK